MGRGLIPAALSLFLPVYILFYNVDASGVGTLTGFVSIGVFYIFTMYTFSPVIGSSQDASSFLIFDPNWYLDIEKYLTDFNYSSGAKAMSDAMGTLYGVGCGYGNFKDYLGGDDIALGITGMLMGVFLICTIIGIILNVTQAEKPAGFLFIVAGAAALLSMLLAWNAISDEAVTSVIFGGSLSEGHWIPIPVGALLVLLGGIRGVTTKSSETY